MQLYAVNFIPLLGSLYMFRGCFIHPSSGVQFLTVSTATGTNHSIVSATYYLRGLVPGHAGNKYTMVCTSGCRYS